MRTHQTLLCRWWWLAPIALLAFGLTDGLGSLPGCSFRSARRPATVAVVEAPRGKDPTKLAVPDRNLVNLTDKNISLDFSFEEDKEMGLVWKARLGKMASYGGPVVAGGKVFVCTNNENPRDPNLKEDAGIVMCFDEKTGKFLWQSYHERIPDEAINYAHQGIASTPFVDGDRLYYLSNRCELVCADVNGDPKKPGKAKIIWSLDMLKELKVYPSQLASSSPTVYGDLVFCVTSNGVNIGEDPATLPSPDAPSFIAVNKMTGKVKWSSAAPGKEIMEGQWTSPTIIAPKGGKPQVLFPGGDGWLYSFEPESGKVIWKFNCNPKNAVFNRKNKRITDKSYFLATPVLWEDRVYIGLGASPQDGPGMGRLWCIDPTRTGDVSPVDDRFDPANPKNKDSALVWHVGGKIDPEPERGKKWYFGRTLSTCAIHDGLLYAADLDGYFTCFDARTGKRYWEADLRSPVWGSPYWVDGKVFIGNDDGDLYVFAHGKEKKQLAKIEIGAAIRMPVKVVNGVLYVLTDSYLYAVKPK
jgi:outer membrane protein assembly factor BamB